VFFKVFKWEFLSGKRFYLILLIYFLLLFSSGRLVSSKYVVEERRSGFYIKEDVTPGRVIDIRWHTSSLWWFLFPVVLAYTVFVFSYELDKGILRAYLLSCVKKRTLFIAKLLSIILSLFIPLVACLLIVYALADPQLFMVDPLEVYVNVPRRLLLCALMLYTMMGIAILSSIIFKRPLYAFGIPMAVIYVLNIVSLRGISDYIPPRCYSRLSYSESIGLVPTEALINALRIAIPSLIASTIFLIAAYIIFIRRDVA